MVRRLGASRSVLPGALLALLLIASLAVPVADAETVVFDTVQVKMTPMAFDAELRDQQIVDDRAVSLRTYIDEEHGDADGLVTAEEYEAYRVAEVARFNGQLDNPIATGLFADIKVNTRGARGIEVTDVQLSDNIVGSASDNDTVQRHVLARLTFSATEKTRVNVSFEQDFRVPFRIIEMEWGVAHFTGGDVWAIDPGTFVPGDTDRFWQDGALVVPYAETGGLSNKDDHMRLDLVDTTAESLTQEKKDKKGSPGVATSALLIAVVALAALSRRRL